MNKHKRKYGLFIALLLLAPYLYGQIPSTNAYLSGGEITYKFVSVGYDGLGVPQYTYDITVTYYEDCKEDDIWSKAGLRIMFNAIPPPFPGSYIEYRAVGLGLKDRYTTEKPSSSCSSSPLSTCYNVRVYGARITLPEMSSPWLLVIQDSARRENRYRNVSTIPGELPIGFTYLTEIPGRPTDIPPSSPVFKNQYPPIYCTSKPFKYDCSVNDIDGDSLVYSFTPAYQFSAVTPPFTILYYYDIFTPFTPLGAGVSIDPATGMVSGNAPPAAGKYIVAVSVKKYRNGVYQATQRKEFEFTFADCTWPQAQLDTLYRNCKGYDLHFTNYSTGVINNYYWNFGDPTTLADTSTLFEPTYHYPGPGVYNVQLILNKGTTLCKDTAFCKVIVDSGLNASFIPKRLLDVCHEAIFSFTNTSTAGSYPITKYAWDFGEITKTDDVSSLQNPPNYNYPTEGSKKVRLIINTDIGCSDTATQIIKAYKNLMTAPNDTTVCNLDYTVLRPETNGYAGIFAWSPNYNISSLSSPTPSVHPQVDTTYYIEFTDATGCVSKDSVKVKVRSTVNMYIDHIDTTICKLDTLTLHVIHDGINVTWNPATDVTTLVPDGSWVYAFPGTPTSLIATAHFGSCVAADTIPIKVVPKPFVTINNDTTVCFGAPVYLHATGGAYYLWTPAATLDNPIIANPVAHPVDPKTTYIVSVYDTLGCPKHTIAYVKINAFRGLIAHAEKDTMIVQGEPVQLEGYGGQYYHWSPSAYLSNPSISNPVASSYGDITYVLSVSNDDNCVDKDSVRVRAFKDPDIYVPTAFTPNNDGRNDVFKVFPVGFELKELKIFDRWGSIVFVTTDYTKGWNGKRGGIDIASGTFVWVATGKNSKTGAAVTKKGLVTLIR